MKALVLESPFKKLIKKTAIQVFSCEVREVFKSNFFCRIALVTAYAPQVAASVFFENRNDN